MKEECLKFIRRLQCAEEGLDRETLEHCRRCPQCRQYLLFRLQAPAAEKISMQTDQQVLALCRREHCALPGRIFRRKLLWTCSFASVMLFLLAGIFLFRSSAEDLQEIRRENELTMELTDIRLALSRISREITRESILQ